MPALFYDLPALLLVGSGASASVYWKKLTPYAGIAGGICGCFIYLGDGYRGLILLATFFFLGTAATAWNKDEKSRMPHREKDPEMRLPGQVLANGGVAAFCGLIMSLAPAHKALWELMMASSLAAATADTLSSELGILYGSRHYNILTWKLDHNGWNGVVSVEGFLLGLLGSGTIALVYALDNNTGIRWLIVILAGTLGNLADSYLGATLERKHWLGNDGVNLACSLTGALTALIFGLL